MSGRRRSSSQDAPAEPNPTPMSGDEGVAVVPLDEQDAEVPATADGREQVAKDRRQREAEMAAYGITGHVDDENALDRAKDEATAPGTEDVEGHERVDEVRARQEEKHAEQEAKRDEQRQEQADRRAAQQEAPKEP